MRDYSNLTAEIVESKITAIEAMLQAQQRDNRIFSEIVRDVKLSFLALMRLNVLTGFQS